MVTVSVVIPAKNDAAALARCLNALQFQSRPPDEVIVVDNASTDNTAHVARGFGARVISQPLPGIPAASTAGYDSARFDVICRLDADSLPPPTWIENGLLALEAVPSVDAVTGPGEFYDGPRRAAGIIAAAYLGAYFTSLRFALGVTPLFGSNFFLRRSAWSSVRDTVHRSGLTFHDDLDLTIHLTPQHRIRYDPAVRVGISFRPFTQPGTYALRVWRGFWTLTRNWPRSSSTLRWRRKLLHHIAPSQPRASIRSPRPPL